jgi:hypothetical protein
MNVPGAKKPQKCPPIGSQVRLLPLPKRGKGGNLAKLGYGEGGRKTTASAEMAAGRGRQDFCERENAGFPEIEMADLTQFRGPSYVGGGGGRVIYVNT